LSFFHLHDLNEQELKPEKALDLLKLNVRLVIAKAGIELRIGSSSNFLIWIGSNLPASEITPESVKIHIGAVLGAARQLRQ